MPRVTVLDMQVIDPPVGGGRLRLLGLYHAFPQAMPVLYVGTYDWPGCSAREQHLSPGLTERLVPLSEDHFTEVQILSAKVGGRTVIDSAFHLQAHLSPEFLKEARAAAAAADIVIFSHPWLHPLTADVLDRNRQLIVYDAHNIEGKLRTQLLDDGAEGTRIAREVVRAEYSLCQVANLTLCCSRDDAEGFHRLYGVPIERTRVVPNGAFTTRILPADAQTKASARAAIGLGVRPAAIFLGSGYPPNVEAARHIVERVAPDLPEVDFVIAGGVGDQLNELSFPGNVRVTGLISEQEKFQWLAATDMAVNPMFSGSGTNIKMLDYMAAGLPVITTPIGARGISTSAPAFVVAEAGSPLVEAIRQYAENEALRAELGRTAREQAERYYSWERISAQLGIVLENHWRRLSRKPTVSVIVPTYERHSMLSSLMTDFGAQRFRDFEVIIIDQSAEPWRDRDRDFGFDLVYIHSDVKGAVTARNLGGAVSAGSIIAFTDDDCKPDFGWLEGGIRAFDDPEVVGVEGLIVSDRIGDPEWRPVTNIGFEGIGFMTANLFIRAAAFTRWGALISHSKTRIFARTPTLVGARRNWGNFRFRTRPGSTTRRIRVRLSAKVSPPARLSSSMTCGYGVSIHSGFSTSSVQNSSGAITRITGLICKMAFVARGWICRWRSAQYMRQADHGKSTPSGRALHLFVRTQVFYGYETNNHSNFVMCLTFLCWHDDCQSSARFDGVTFPPIKNFEQLKGFRLHVRELAMNPS